MEVNRIYNMDCLEGTKKIEDKSVQTIIADPPYYLGMTHNGTKGEFADLAIAKPFFAELFREFKRALRLDGAAYLFCDWRSMPFYGPLFNEILDLKNCLVWVKHGRPQIKNYGNGYEMILFSGKTKKNYVSNVLTDIKSFNLIKGEQMEAECKIHPTQKPIALIQRLIEDSSSEGDLILDPFIGSGTTAVAAVRTNRQFIGFELQEHFCELANKRLLKCGNSL